MGFSGKKKVLSLLIFFFAFELSAEKSKNEMFSMVLSGLRITTSYINTFNLNDMERYSKNSYGGNIGFEYTLFPQMVKNVDLGFYGRAAFLNFVPYNVQLVRLYSYSFSSGLFGQFYLPYDFSLQMSFGAGFLISDIDFVSAEKGKINDIYYDFMIESDFNIRKAILKTKIVNLLGTAGCHYAFYNEKSESFMSIGPVFGLIVDFKPFCSKKSGVQK